MNFFLKGLLAFLCLLILIACIEFGYFYTILQRPYSGQPADLIAVFAGAQDRIEAGYRLARMNIAPSMVISPASRQTIAIYDRRYGRIPGVSHLIENRADTTFQNALLVGRLMRRHKKRSEILVTSDYHMPRSYLLMRIEMIGTDTVIHPYPVLSRPFDENPLTWSVRQKKQIYNEMVECWGSLFEKLLYHVQGDISQRRLKQNKTLCFLKQLLLFEV